MSKNYDIKSVNVDVNYQDTKFSYKALQLTPKSDKNIVAHYDRAIRDSRKKEGLKAIFGGEKENKKENKKEKNTVALEKIAKLEENLGIGILIENDVLVGGQKMSDNGKKPIKLIPKMYIPMSKFYEDARAIIPTAKVNKEEIPVEEDVKEEIVEKELESPYLPNLEEAEIELKTDEKEIGLEDKVEEKIEDFDFEARLSKALEEIAKRREESKEEPKKIEENDKVEEIEETEKVEKAAKVEEPREEVKSSSEISNLKEQFIKYKQELKEQSDDLAKARKAKEKLEKAKKEAELAKSEAISKLVEFNKEQQKQVDKNSELISELNRSNEKESEDVRNLNRETEDLLAMLEENQYEEDFTMGAKAA